MRRNTANKEVVLGVTGSIAAYKACEIASRLVERGIRVTPVLTESATNLVNPMAFEAITGSRAITAMFERLPNPEVEHISVATRASLFLIAPATANILAKAAHGIADDWLSTVLLATRAPIVFAPAMNTNMYDHPATQANIAVLKERGALFVGPGAGRLACGTTGVGRMLDTHLVLEAVLPLLEDNKDLAGKRIVITSGGTREPIDPVRFIGNRSSGKMGRALALEALTRGALVTVITGPAEASPPFGAEVHRVETALEMADAVERVGADTDVFIGAAAVADYRVEEPATSKRKRDGRPVSLTLVENPDIVAGVAARRNPGAVVVAFAAETDNLVANARDKLRRKGADLVVANRVGTPESGFGTEALEACIIGRDDDTPEPAFVSKDDLACMLFDRIASLLD